MPSKDTSAGHDSLTFSDDLELLRDEKLNEDSPPNTLRITLVTWEHRVHEVFCAPLTTVRQLKDLYSREHPSVPFEGLRLLEIDREPCLEQPHGCPKSELPWSTIEHPDDCVLTKSTTFQLLCKPFSGPFLKGGTCPHLERSPEDFARSDRSPWGRHVPHNWVHLLALRAHGYAAFIVWVLVAAVYFTKKGSSAHVILGRTVAYGILPISLASGLYLFSMLFHRSTQFENIMKADGPATITVFSVEMLLTYSELLIVPSLRARLGPVGVSNLSIFMAVAHIAAIAIYFGCLRVLLSSVSRNRHATKCPKTSAAVHDAAFENAIELLILVPPMVIVNLCNLLVHLRSPVGVWTWVAHHKLNAVLLGYIMLPGTTLPIGRDAFWIFSKKLEGPVAQPAGLHNIRDRVLVMNVPIVLYFCLAWFPIQSSLQQLAPM